MPRRERDRRDVCDEHPSPYRGFVIRQSFEDLQLRLADGGIRLFRRAGDRFRPVTSETDWPSYDGGLRGYRSTTLKRDRSGQRRAARAAMDVHRRGHLAARDHAGRVERRHVRHAAATSATRSTRERAARSGASAARSRRDSSGTRRAASTAASPSIAPTSTWRPTTRISSRSIATTGEIAWETVMADARENYSATGAPLVAGGLVIAGIAGGDGGARGFLAAYDPQTGKEVWRFWTTPAPGEPARQHLGRTGAPASGRTDVAHRQLRSRARDALLDDGQSGIRSQRRRAEGRQSLRRFAARARRPHRTTQVALPVHAARPLGLGRAGAARAHRCRRGKASRASSSCRRIATASSTCSIAPTASCSSAVASSRS